MESLKISEKAETKNILKGIGISLIVTIILLLIFSVILTYSNISENIISPVIMIITAISILIGSSISNRKIKKNKIDKVRTIRRWICLHSTELH